MYTQILANYGQIVHICFVGEIAALASYMFWI